ncbi:RNA polymerase sigma factor [Pedobacter lithocola]|uniref:RNA polymerase sigma factor n=1 Tax=Pedobacter lithocola TaxID=1908239 RepID=A0ABV8PCI0_9SPHI
MPSNKLSDLELLQSVVCDNEKAFNELFERHWLKVYGVSFRYVKDEESAMEITHDVFLNIWNKRDKLIINSFISYIIAAASYHSIRRFKQKKTVALSYIEHYDQDDNNTHISTNNDGHEKMLVEELDQKVLRSLDELPKRCREIYLLSRKDELSIAEIADKLNVSKRTVENQITIALKHIKSLLKDSYILFL